MSNYRKYYPQPTFVNVNEEGEITLEWCVGKPRDARLLFVLDGSKQIGELDSHTYAIYTTDTEQNMFLVEGPEDVIIAMKMIGLEPTE